MLLGARLQAQQMQHHILKRKRTTSQIERQARATEGWDILKLCDLTSIQQKPKSWNIIILVPLK